MPRVVGVIAARMHFDCSAPHRRVLPRGSPTADSPSIGDIRDHRAGALKAPARLFWVKSGTQCRQKAVRYGLPHRY
jgi:hypothetical protein